MLWLSLTCEVTWLPSEPDLGTGRPSVSASARLGRGLAEDTRLLVTELLRLTLFSRAEILGRALGSVSRCRESARPGIDWDLAMSNDANDSLFA